MLLKLRRYYNRFDKHLFFIAKLIYFDKHFTQILFYHLTLIVCSTQTITAVLKEIIMSQLSNKTLLDFHIIKIGCYHRRGLDYARSST